MARKTKLELVNEAIEKRDKQLRRLYQKQCKLQREIALLKRSQMEHKA